MHWLYFHLSIRSDELQVHWFDGLRTEIPCSLGKIAQLFVDALALKHDIHWVHSCPFCQTHGQHCGAVALLHIGISLGLWDASDEGTAELWFQQLLARQRRQGFGPNDEAAVLEWLANFLPSKGALPEDAMGRAKLALKKLGLSALQHAIKQKDPIRGVHSRLLEVLLGNLFSGLVSRNSSNMLLIDRHMGLKLVTSRNKNVLETKGLLKWLLCHLTRLSCSLLLLLMTMRMKFCPLVSLILCRMLGGFALSQLSRLSSFAKVILI